ncbi:MAG: amidohydrolase family protein [Chlorobi bacterium]|nr:amidohydrolase family protein [Chlorobiota bacterium]
MRKIAANYIFPIASKPIKNGIIEVNDNGEILNIINPGDNFKESAQLEFYNGILVPGFINTHCHLELSHLKSKIKEHIGLPAFITEIQQKRLKSPEEKINAMLNADRQMWNNGIVAVGDISNTNSSFDLKEKSKIKYYTFIEIYNTPNHNDDVIFFSAEKLAEQTELKTSIVPHAPYSVTKTLLKNITNRAYLKESIISMHNQETASENTLFVEGNGELKKSLELLGEEFSDWKPTGFNSLQSTLVHLSKCNKTMLVHNTYTNENDINWVLNYFYPPENKSFQKSRIHLLYFALCPNANLFIENKLPDILMFIKKGLKLTIGTDSLASNRQLSVLEEIKAIQTHFPEIKLENLLKWATLNGAEALGFSKMLGSFEIGKTPGINLITDIDFNKMRITEKSMVEKLI